MSLFLEGAGRVLLVLHALVAFALLGASTHLALVSVWLLRERYHLARLARVYSQVIGGTLVAAFSLGLLLYPNYRINVRGYYLDRYAIWASNLFDMKENLAAFALPIGVCLFFVGRSLNPKDERAALPFFTFLSVSAWALVACAAIFGLVVTSVKGV